MSEEWESQTRKNRYVKKRKNTKLITGLSIVGIILIAILIFMLIFGGDDEKDQKEENNQPTEQQEQQDQDQQQEQEDNSGTEDQNNEEMDESPNQQEDQASDSEGEVETNPVESEDENVSEAYEGNWNPVGTVQEGPHTTSYDDGSVDRQEMSKAVEVATGIPAEEQTIWWVGRAGDQSVEYTVSRKDEETTYRVHLTWIENEGWKPTLVEQLIENKHK